MDDRDHRHAHRLDARAAPRRGTGCRRRRRSGACAGARGQRSISRSPKVCISGKTPKRETPSSQSESGFSRRRRGSGSTPSPRGAQAEDVVVRDLVERDAGVELGQRRSGEHVHVVAGALPLAREVGGVDALSAAVHVAAIGEERDAHRAARGSGRERPTRSSRAAAGAAPGRSRARPGRSRSSSRPRTSGRGRRRSGSRPGSRAPSSSRAEFRCVNKQSEDHCADADRPTLGSRRVVHDPSGPGW